MLFLLSFDLGVAYSDAQGSKLARDCTYLDTLNRKPVLSPLNTGKHFLGGKSTKQECPGSPLGILCQCCKQNRTRLF